MPILSLTRSAPHILQQPIALSKTINAIIGFPHRANETTKSIGDIFPGIATILIYLADRDLNRSMILCLDDSVCGGALSGDVAGKFTRIVRKAFMTVIATVIATAKVDARIMRM